MREVSKYNKYLNYSLYLSINIIVMSAEENKNPQKSKFIVWLKRLGFWGFLFFLLKGLIWLALGYWVLK